MNSVVDRWTEVNTFLRERTQKKLRRDELDEIMKTLVNLMNNYNFIQLGNLEGDADWELLFDLCGGSNLHLSDNIHLVTAYIWGCTHLVTRDAFFIKEGNDILTYSDVKPEELQVCTPKKILELDILRGI